MWFIFMLWFKSLGSATSTLVSICDHIITALDSKKTTSVNVFCSDLSRAFDKLQHLRLMNHLGLNTGFLHVGCCHIFKTIQWEWKWRMHNSIWCSPGLWARTVPIYCILGSDIFWRKSYEQYEVCRWCDHHWNHLTKLTNYHCRWRTWQNIFSKWPCAE